MFGFAILLDRRRRTTFLHYAIDGDLAVRFSCLRRSCEALSRAEKIWRVSSINPSWNQAREAGTRLLTSRHVIRVERRGPLFIKTNVDVWCIDLRPEQFFFLSDRLLVLKGRSLVAVPYASLCLDCSIIKFVEDEHVPADARVIGYVSENRRVSTRPFPPKSRQRAITSYAQIEMLGFTQESIRILISSVPAARGFAASFTRRVRRRVKPSASQQARKARPKQECVVQRTIRPGDPPQLMLGVSTGASLREITAAYRKLAKLHHPDNFAKATPEQQESAHREMALINHAFEELKSRRAKP